MSGAAPFNVSELVAALGTGRHFDYLAFWGHVPQSPGTIDTACLSQWWPAVFEVDDVRYSSAEQFMMAEKARMMGDGAAFEKIMATSDPHQAKAIARQVANYDDRLWRGARTEVVLRGSVAKFSSNPALHRFLVDTAPHVLVEASPHDLVWGIGVTADDPRVDHPYRWRGQNLLGFTLMRARELLTGSAPVDR